jgi:hypothetical protein
MVGKSVRKFDTKETIAARVPLNEMVVEEYQGHVNQSLVEKIAKNWSDPAAGAVILNLREDNTYAVLDGQHRVLAARKVGQTELNALVFVGKTIEEEARLFVQLNTKHNVSSRDRFKANLFAGRTQEKNIRLILREVGLDVGVAGPSRDGRVMQCPSVLLEVYEAFGPAHLKTVAGILTAAYDQYDDRAKGYCGPSWMAVSQMLFRYAKEINTQRLIQKLKEKSPTVLQGMADMNTAPGQSMWLGWGKTITGMYNHGFRSSYSGYLPPMRWDQRRYTPAGKGSIKGKTARVESLKKARAASQRNAATRRELREALPFAAKQGSK